ncbi:transposase, partial [Rhodococcus sp. T2V]|nr:transposase [Rhodococcus sp. T2V]
MPSQVTVSCNARGQYHISILVEDTIAELEPVDRVVGLDAGITSLYTLSTTQVTAPPDELPASNVLSQVRRGAKQKAVRWLFGAQPGGARVAKPRRPIVRRVDVSPRS